MQEKLQRKKKKSSVRLRRQIEEERVRLHKEEAGETISDDKLAAILGEKNSEIKEAPQDTEIQPESGAEEIEESEESEETEAVEESEQE